MKKASQQGGLFFMLVNKKVAIQGLRGSFHHEATGLYFDHSTDLIECETFQDVITSILDGSADVGVMAIENSLAGSIIPNYNLVRKNAVEIAGEVGLRVRMNIIAQPGTSLHDLIEVQSHQMALRQCQGFFSSRPKIKLVESFDTAGSVKNIADKQFKNIGAIASQQAAKEYGMEIIQAGIEDHNLNYTRFLILQKKGGESVSNPDKVSIYFQTSHEAGSLAQTLTIISGLGINLTKLQSHPVPSKNTLYGFFATLQITTLDQLTDLKIIMNRLALSFEVLGVYKKGETHG